ncbi:Oidioi.mRNA.OKI2018_I69.PAR.g9616.t1.cds [Oikopleura dioica]|uniref:Oidioi.mRNA.OKI2018_I69.PAR.g9616.t1.cds n=1 Tax=Oikopleura dioica TaxID=34765 RepID=A0ABN7RU38_OIKDI|nr:Oidioi.mRNA.OKI2018_I69.PAR.g9616.t1.cds [Oikopleura dioica]
MWWWWLLLATVQGNNDPLPAPEYTGGAGKCVMSWTKSDGCGKNPRLTAIETDFRSLPDPDLGWMDDNGRECILNNRTRDDPDPGLPDLSPLLDLVGPNAAPCYEPAGIDAEEPNRLHQNLLQKICPKFAETHDKVCCSYPQMQDFDKKFNKMYKGFFQACPSCLKSQLEYYCNLYCHPEQSDFITVNQVFNATNDKTEKQGVDHFTAALPISYTDDLFDTCKTVKFTWFVNTPCINDLIPSDGLARNLVYDRFCRDVPSKDCTPYVWLNNQGQAITEWPRFGTLNNVKAGPEDGPAGHVYSCTEDLTPIYAAPGIDADTPVECGCQNCAESCPEVKEIDLQDPFHLDQIDRSFGSCLFRPTCGPNYLIPNGDGLNRPDVPCMAYDRPAYEWREENDADRGFLERLYEVCPRYLNNSLDGTYTMTCCDQIQMNTLRDQVSQIRQLFGRCPACVENAINMFCHSTCAPDQASFIDP